LATGLRCQGPFDLPASLTRPLCPTPIHVRTGDPTMMDYTAQPPEPPQPPSSSSHHHFLQPPPLGVDPVGVSLIVPPIPSPPFSHLMPQSPLAPPQQAREQQPRQQSQQHHGDAKEADSGEGKKKRSATRKVSKLSDELKIYFRTCFQSWEGHPYDRKFFFEALAKRTNVPRPVITKYYYNDRRRKYVP